MGAVWFRARAELRARWRAWLASALLVGAFGGATAAAAAGARRTTSAYPRFLEHARSFDIFLGDFSVFAPDLFWQPDFDALEQSPLVEEAARVQYFFGLADDEVVAPLDESLGTLINRPKIIEGRMPSAPDEVSMPFAWDRPESLSVGDRFTMSYDDVPGGVDLTVVGIHAMPGDFPPTDLLGEAFLAAPSFATRHAGSLPGTSGSFFRLADGVTESEFEGRIREMAGGKLANAYRNGDQAQNVQRSFDLQAVALWLLAGGLGIGAVLVLGQSIARQVTLDADDSTVLRALGMSRGQIRSVMVLRAVASGVLGGALAVVCAVAASPLFPRGLARVAEPDAGVAVDVTVLGLVFASCILLAAVAAILPSLRARDRASAPARPSRAASMAARLGWSPPAVAGVRFGLEPGRGLSAVPVRSTIFAVALGLAALTAAFAFASNLDTLLRTPHLYGRGWNHEYGFGGDFSAVPASAARAARDDPSVEAAASGTLGLTFELHVPGEEVLPVTGMALADWMKGSVVTAPSEGRYPRQGEIVLGPRTMAKLGVQVGDEIGVAMQGAGSHPLTVVGEVLLPPLAEHSQFGDGLLVSYETLGSQLAPPGLADGAPPPDQLLVRFAGERPHREEVEVFRAKLEKVDQDYELAEATDLVNFGRVQNMPLILAGLLAMLATGALAHVLLTAIRRRGRDIAILKTLGFDRAQARRTVGWQASSVVLTALAIGIPLGIAAGRFLWGQFAIRTYILVEHATPWTAIAVTIPAALLLANLVAQPPARAAARTRAAVVLRSE